MSDVAALRAQFNATRTNTARGSDENRDEPASVPIEVQLENARQRRDELLRQRELHRIHEEIALLERNESAIPSIEGSPSAHPRDTPSEGPARHKRRKSESEDERPRKRSAKLKDPTVYTGNSLKQYRNFVRDCELAAKNAPDYFPTEEDLVT